MTGTQAAINNHRLNSVRKRKQAQHIGDMAAAFAHGPGQVFLGVGEFLHQPLVTVGFLQGGQVLSLQILDQGDFKGFLIDSPPALGLLTINALVAAQAVLVPLQCEFFALEGISHLIKSIERIRKSFNPGLNLQGIVLTMFDRRNNLSGQVANDVREYFGDKVYNTVIPRNVKVSEAPSYGRPVLVYDLACAGSQAYLHLAGEVIRRERKASA